MPSEYIRNLLIHSFTIISDCRNSDGLTGYTFSHEGFFKTRYVSSSIKNNATDCADDCDDDDKCVAFNYEYDGSNHCYTYHTLSERIYDKGTNKAYVKCFGMHLAIKISYWFLELNYWKIS